MSQPSIYPALQIKTPDFINALQQYANVTKTDAETGKIGAETVTERERPDLVRAEAELNRAQAGFQGAQTTKTQLENQLAVLNAIWRMQAYGASGAGGGNQGSSYTSGGGGDGKSSVPNSGETYKPGTSGASLVQTEGEGEGGGGQGGGGGTQAQPQPQPQPTPNASTADNSADYGNYDNPRHISPSAWSGGAKPAPAPANTAAAAPQNQLALYATNAAQTATPAAAPANAETLPTMREQATAQAPGPLSGITLPAGPLNLQQITQAAPRPGGGDNPPGGIQIPGVNGPIPYNMWMLDALNAKESPVELAKKWNDIRNNVLTNFLNTSTDQASYVRNVESAFSQGWIRRSEAADLLKNGGQDWQAQVQYHTRALQTASEINSSRNAERTAGVVVQPGGERPDQLQLAQKPPVPVKIAIPDPKHPNDPAYATTQEFNFPQTLWVNKQLDQPGNGRFPFQFTAKGSDGNEHVVTKYLTPQELQQVQGGQGGGQGGGGQQGANQPGGSWGGYLGRVQGAEIGSGGPRPNPNSSADGNYQFTKDTWLDQVKRNFPQAAAGKTDQQILGMRGNLDFENQVMRTYTAENADKLRAANMPINATTLHTAHWFGAQGAARIMQSDASTPLGKIIDADTLAANRISPDTRVGDLLAYEKRRFGLGKVDIGGVAASQTAGGGAGGGGTQTAGPGAPTAPAGVAPNGGAISGTGASGGTTSAPAPAAQQQPSGLPQPPGTEGAIGGAVTVGPGRQAEIDVAKQQQEKFNEIQLAQLKATEEQYGKVASDNLAQGYAAPKQLVQLAELEQAAKDFTTGPAGQTRAAAYKRLVGAMGAFGIQPPDWLTERAAGAEVINKLGSFLAANQVHLMGDRAASVFSAVRNVYPNIDMTKMGYSDVLNAMKQEQYRARDLARFQEEYMQTHRSIAGLNDAFEKVHPMEEYSSRVIAMPWPGPDKAKDNVIYRNEQGSTRLYFHGKMWAPQTPPEGAGQG